MSVSLLDIFHIHAYTGLDLSLLANAPLFMLGVFLVFELHWFAFSRQTCLGHKPDTAVDYTNLHTAFLSLS